MIIGSGKTTPICAAQHDDDPCPRLAAHFPCGVPVCGEHLDALTNELTDLMGSRTVRTITVNRNITAVVYYMGRPDTQTVKIGTSTNLTGRFRTLRNTHRRLVVLAAEPGHYGLERSRHVQFARWLVEGEKEWFYKAPEIMEHVNALRAKHGDPWAVAASHGLPAASKKPEAKPEAKPSRRMPKPRVNKSWVQPDRPRWADMAAEVMRLAAASQPDELIARSLGVDVGEVHRIISECRARN